MDIDKTLYPKLTEGPLGLWVNDDTAREIEDAIKANPEIESFGYQKAFVTKAASDFSEGERSDISVITSGAFDRDKEIMITRGINFDSFLKNPIVTWNHNYNTPPIGKALWIKRQADAIKAKTRYSTRPSEHPKDLEWLPDTVWHLVKEGDLRGKSIGFLPIDAGPPTADEVKADKAFKEARIVFRKSILIEYAVAPLQSNPDAVVEAVAKGICTEACLRELNLKIPRIKPPEPVKVTGYVSMETMQEIMKSTIANVMRQIDFGQAVSEAINHERGRV